MCRRSGSLQGVHDVASFELWRWPSANSDCGNGADVSTKTLAASTRRDGEEWRLPTFHTWPSVYRVAHSDHVDQEAIGEAMEVLLRLVVVRNAWTRLDQHLQEPPLLDFVAELERLHRDAVAQIGDGDEALRRELDELYSEARREFGNAAEDDRVGHAALREVAAVTLGELNDLLENAVSPLRRIKPLLAGVIGRGPERLVGRVQDKPKNAAKRPSRRKAATHFLRLQDVRLNALRPLLKGLAKQHAADDTAFAKAASTLLREADVDIDEQTITQKVALLANGSSPGQTWVSIAGGPHEAVKALLQRLGFSGASVSRYMPKLLEKLELESCAPLVSVASDDPPSRQDLAREALRALGYSELHIHEAVSKLSKTEAELVADWDLVVASK